FAACYVSTGFCIDLAVPEISTLSLHVALPIFGTALAFAEDVRSGIILGCLLSVLWLAVVSVRTGASAPKADLGTAPAGSFKTARSEEHTSELQSRENLVCRLLLEKKKIRDGAY